MTRLNWGILLLNSSSLVFYRDVDFCRSKWKTAYIISAESVANALTNLVNNLYVQPLTEHVTAGNKWTKSMDVIVRRVKCQRHLWVEAFVRMCVRDFTGIKHVLNVDRQMLQLPMMQHGSFPTMLTRGSEEALCNAVVSVAHFCAAMNVYKATNVL